MVFCDAQSGVHRLALPHSCAVKPRRSMPPSSHPQNTVGEIPHRPIPKYGR